MDYKIKCSLDFVFSLKIIKDSCIPFLFKLDTKHKMYKIFIERFIEKAKKFIAYVFTFLESKKNE